jgi:hypothetical protein
MATLLLDLMQFEHDERLRADPVYQQRQRERQREREAREYHDSLAKLARFGDQDQIRRMHIRRYQYTRDIAQCERDRAEMLRAAESRRVAERRRAEARRLLDSPPTETSTRSHVEEDPPAYPGPRDGLDAQHAQRQQQRSTTHQNLYGQPSYGLFWSDEDAK